MCFPFSFMTLNLSHTHHYVPEWYQKRFLLSGLDKLHVLNLKPDTVRLSSGKSFTHSEYRVAPPSRCFYSDDLYMLRFGRAITDVVERRFFGEVDNIGAAAVDRFSDFSGLKGTAVSSQGDIPAYMGAQRFRTPRGLDWLKQKAGSSDHNRTLAIMSHTFQQYTTMWAEGVWELVRADASKTKFIISEDPVTFYNARMPPSVASYPGTEELSSVGTRTISPLGPDVCLIVTHLQLTRDPEQDATQKRINARTYDQVVMYAGNVQFGRELAEDEVIRINLILKRKATRYIAAGRKEWLYPERATKRDGWATLDQDWFLFPNLWKVPFHTQTLLGGQDGSAWASDEYGRHPGNPRYNDLDRTRRDREHVTRKSAQHKWAKLRKGCSLSHTFEARSDAFDDKIMLEYLKEVSKSVTKFYEDDRCSCGRHTSIYREQRYINDCQSSEQLALCFGWPRRCGP